MPSAGALNPIIDGDVTVSSTALNFRDDYATFGFTEAQALKADVIHIRVYTNTIRYTYAPGTTVTNSTGYAVDAGNELELVGKEIIRNFTMIAESSDATVYFTLSTYGLPV